jgi:transposase-like protein
MGGAVRLRQDFGADELRRFAAKAKDGAQARRLLALAAVHDGMNRSEAARIGGMDRQTLRDWVHRFNQYGPEGLIESSRPGGRRSSPRSRRKCSSSWSRPDPTRRRTESCAGVASI